MKLKGIIDCDFTNYKAPVLTIEMPKCDFKCDRLNKCKVCQNSRLAYEPDINISIDQIWTLYNENPLTKGICLQGLEPFDSSLEVLELVKFIRITKQCNDPIIIYTGYNEHEKLEIEYLIDNYKNIIIKYGRFLIGDAPHYDEVLGVNLASNNQYAKLYI